MLIELFYGRNVLQYNYIENILFLFLAFCYLFLLIFVWVYFFGRTEIQNGHTTGQS